MTRFRDQYAPDDMPSWPCASAPRFSTQEAQVDSGSSQVNQRWEHPLYKFVMPEVIREHETYAAVRDQWLVMRGPLYTWPWRDPLDFASVELEAPTMEPITGPLDQVIGTGDGVTYQFQLTKTYMRGAFDYVRDVHLPVVDTVEVSVAGVTIDPSNFLVSRPGGVITLDFVPTPGQVVRAGYYYDNEVKFENDEAFEGIVQSYAISGYASLTLVEVRPCLGGVS